MDTNTKIILYLVGMMCFLLLIAIEITYQNYRNKLKLQPINENLDVTKWTKDEIDFIENAPTKYLDEFAQILYSIQHIILQCNSKCYIKNDKDIILILDMKIEDLNPPDLRILCHRSGSLEVVYDHHTDPYKSLKDINMSKSLMLNQ